MLATGLQVGGCATQAPTTGLQPAKQVASAGIASSGIASSVIASDVPLDRQLLVTVAQSPAVYAGAPRARLLNGWRQYGPDAQTVQTLAAVSSDYALHQGDGWLISALDVYCAVLVVPAGRSTDTVLEALSRDPRLAAVQRMHRFETRAHPGPRNASATPIPNDPYYNMQTAFQAMSFGAAHTIARGAGVQVAVIDTGVDTQHPELAGQIALYRDFVAPDDGGRRIRSPEQHGTAIVGVIAALADNRIGIAGAAPAVDIWVLRACWQTDTSGAAACNSFTLAKALGFALDQQADVINLSLTGPADPLLEQLTTVAARRGIVVIGAAPARTHNADNNTKAAGFPASANGVIAVQGVSPEKASDTALLLAPDTDVLTLAPNNDYRFVSGDSLATALVTGVAALVLEAKPEISPERLAQVLHTATNETPPVLNACRAVNAVQPVVCKTGPLAAANRTAGKPGDALHLPQ